MRRAHPLLHLGAQPPVLVALLVVVGQRRGGDDLGRGDHLAADRLARESPGRRCRSRPGRPPRERARAPRSARRRRRARRRGCRPRRRPNSRRPRGPARSATSSAPRMVWSLTPKTTSMPGCAAKASPAWRITSRRRPRPSTRWKHQRRPGRSRRSRRGSPRPARGCWAGLRVRRAAPRRVRSQRGLLAAGEAAEGAGALEVARSEVDAADLRRRFGDQDRPPPRDLLAQRVRPLALDRRQDQRIELVRELAGRGRGPASRRPAPPCRPRRRGSG